MPELPEVETIRRTLKERILYRPIQGIDVSYPKVLRNCDQGQLEKALLGRCFTRLDRRGKYLVCCLDSEYRLVIHLRMTGRLVVVPIDTAVEKHTSIRIHLQEDLDLRLVDQRKFATVDLLSGRDWGAIRGLESLGKEPLEGDFTPGYLAAQLAGRRAPVKSVLLDQRRVAGLGNIYVDESLHRAGIFPGKTAGELTEKEIERLHQSIQEVIKEGIAHRGTTFRDYVDGEGRQGGFQALLRVYGREGEPCTTCGEPIARIKLAGRSSFFCPRCQGK
ncbi:MAG: bifunctional DNA-formamidopyrimidine glycosylase/DNA-(apurinic or apyrimidinic site) lyase [Firmicutes bacterium]|nr:bifunctional DNA-formamidopyrimidine glycosylase/DNA-(apurinic or apyrimidinic site) lyase [Bacillota bacterium]